MHKLKIQKCEHCGMEFVVCPESENKVPPSVCRAGYCMNGEMHSPGFESIYCHHGDEWIPNKGWELKEKP